MPEQPVPIGNVGAVSQPLAPSMGPTGSGPGVLERVLPLIALAVGGLLGPERGGGQLFQGFTQGQLLKRQIAEQDAERQLAERRVAQQEETAQAAAEQAKFDRLLKLTELRTDVIRNVAAADSPEAAELLVEEYQKALAPFGVQTTISPALLDATVKGRLQTRATKAFENVAKAYGGEEQLMELLQQDPQMTIPLTDSSLLRAFPQELRITSEQGTPTNSVRLADLATLAGKALFTQGQLAPMPLTDEERDLLELASRITGRSIQSKAEYDKLSARVRLRAQRERAAALRLPPQPPAFEPTVTIDTVDAEGRPVTRVLPRSQAVGQEFVKPPPAAAVEREAARERLIPAISSLENLSRRIITKVGPEQRATAIKRGTEAVFGNDAEFRVYQDTRVALAGNLAVAQQGSRPSDADILRVWLPLVPDPYRDTSESMQMKWSLIRTMMSLPQRDDAPQPGEPPKATIGRFGVEILPDTEPR